MEISDLSQSLGAWLTDTGPMNDVVLSSRIRLARNIRGFLFFAQSDPEEQAELLSFVYEKLRKTELAQSLFFFNMDDLSPMERQMLLERHLISRQLARGDGVRGVALAPDESLALMINEEDHLRIQSLSSGLQLHEAYERINRVDDILEEALEYAFSSKYGYLTACPTNVGTGIRVSVMLHLPALKMANQIEKVFQAARDMKLAIRGLYGEGSEPVGDFYQISNQITLGKSEHEIIEELAREAVEPIVKYERAARKKLCSKRTSALDDKIFRALGVLTNTRMISTEETMYMLSYLRLGAHLNHIKTPLETINRLFLQTKPGHLQYICQSELETEQRDTARADFIRAALQ